MDTDSLRTRTARDTDGTDVTDETDRSFFSYIEDLSLGKLTGRNFRSLVKNFLRNSGFGPKFNKRPTTSISDKDSLGTRIRSGHGWDGCYGRDGSLFFLIRWKTQAL